MPLPESHPLERVLTRIADALEEIAKNTTSKIAPVEHLPKSQRDQLPTANPKKKKGSVGYKG